MHLKDDIYRMYFSSRNKENKTQSGYDILYVSPKPVLELGKLGLFDDSAIWCHWIIEYDMLPICIRA